jgi:hypothetical protein
VAGRQTYEVVGESLREIGILLTVFAPLDTLLLAAHGTGIDWLRAIGIAILGLVLLVAGVRMESET